MNIEDFELDISEEAHDLTRLLWLPTEEDAEGQIRRLIENKPSLIRAHLTVGSGIYESGLLPIHRACFNSDVSDETVLYLAQTFPGALAVKYPSSEGNGMLPIELYVYSRCSFRTVKGLVEAYPACASSVWSSGVTLLHQALRHENDDLVQYLLQHHLSSDVLRAPFAKYGRLPIHLAASKSTISIFSLKSIAEAYPQALTIWDNSNGMCNLPWQLCSNVPKMEVLLDMNPLLVLAENAFAEHFPFVAQRQISAKRIIDASRMALGMVDFRIGFPDEILEDIWAFLVPEVIGISYKEKEIKQGQKKHECEP